MTSEGNAGQVETKAARLPVPGAHGRRSLRADELGSLSAQDQAAVDKLLGLPALEDD